MKKNLLLLFISALLFAGCSSEYQILESYSSVILTADSSVKRIGEPVTFTVKDGDGNDLTAESVIYVDGEEIEGNTYTSQTVGSHEVKAGYLSIESAPLMINFHDGSEINFVKRVLIEDYTGTWCGYCPRVAHAIELVKAQTDEPLATAVPVAIHRPSSNPNSLNYDPYNFDTSELEALLNVAGYPKGYLNRMTLWTNPEPENVGQAIALTQGDNPKLGLALHPVVENGNLTLDVNIKFGKDFSNLKLVVYVLENSLVYEQHNYTEYYDGMDVIEDFEHNHVLRATLTHLLGDDITGTTTIANTYTRNFTAPVPASITNAANIEIVAFVVDEDGNAINVRKAVPSEDQEFEEL